MQSQAQLIRSNNIAAPTPTSSRENNLISTQATVHQLAAYRYRAEPGLLYMSTLAYNSEQIGSDAYQTVSRYTNAWGLATLSDFGSQASSTKPSAVEVKTIVSEPVAYCSSPPTYESVLESGVSQSMTQMQRCAPAQPVDETF